MPNGLATEHMLLLIGEVDGEAIGWMWLALPSRAPSCRHGLGLQR